jgi:hypothetical protein
MEYSTMNNKLEQKPEQVDANLTPVYPATIATSLALLEAEIALLKQEVERKKLQPQKISDINFVTPSTQALNQSQQQQAPRQGSKVNVVFAVPSESVQVKIG